MNKLRESILDMYTESNVNTLEFIGMLEGIKLGLSMTIMFEDEETESELNEENPSER